jgi:hypothetical protein
MSNTSELGRVDSCREPPITLSFNINLGEWSLAAITSKPPKCQWNWFVLKIVSQGENESNFYLIQIQCTQI